ncbi:hypothetical protein BX616_001446 [Lobosporangium transversale]|uniref:Uncharacterized protein n=1 Tax=Lobosporangium transversale TaxID=64571 RepID=A0A1Y2GUW9_9FUNG|nr:hypothetical protein BCR41DRAFT_351776 [Lobosporangium transversale]KAF9903984.1 hypothetical protein BX616_001446 [Lobosporangium transversale]ORZ19221.1 hypothetical protein BCR41DRAFT_351776 [Lobosporangium transversale]|eukprot:XP_021882389.1 hypothetical protein BCR41DRAFT_351776 [Lobosporangium transversale]
MASYLRAKVDSSTQTDAPRPFTALLDRTLDRIEATVPLNLSSITFYIRRHHLSRIEQIESLLSESFIFRFILFRIGLKPQHVFSFLCLLTLYACRQLYKRSVYLTTNLCAVAYPAYCSIRTINSDPIPPPKGLGLEPTEYSPVYSHRRRNSIYSTSGSIRSSNNRNRARKNRHRMSTNSMLEESMQSSNSYNSGNSGNSSPEEDYESSRRSISSSWGRPSEYSAYSDFDNITSTSGSVSVTVEERMKQRMRRRWAQFSQKRKDKATRQWLAYWSIYGTVQVVDTWSSFLLDWIPGYNLGKLLFLWWAQRRGATLIFDYFQPLIQSKNKDGREVARKPSNRSLNSEMSQSERGGSTKGGEGGGSSETGGGGPVGSGSHSSSIQVLPSTLARHQQQQYQQYQQQQPQYQQQLFEQQFYAKGASSRRNTAAFRDLNQARHRGDNLYNDEDDQDDEEDFRGHHYQHQQQQQQHRRQAQHLHQQPMDLRRELMNSSPHDSGSFAETPLYDSPESVWSVPPSSLSQQAIDDSESISERARLHSNNATPTPTSVQQRLTSIPSEKLIIRQTLISETHSDAAASTIHWNPSSAQDY